MTRRDDVSTSVRAMKAGAVDVLTKPYDDDDLLAAVRQVMSRRIPPRLITGESGTGKELVLISREAASR